jgi:dolichol-phosphate mannosyltransferase
MKNATVILPTYNEAGNIEKVIDRIISVLESIPNWNISILVVDSHSQDKTSNIVKTLQKKYRQIHLLETKKEGLGRAYVQGFTYAMEHLNPYLVFEMDADLSHNPDNIPDFLKRIENGADFVIGSRYMKGGSIPKDWGIHRKAFSLFGNLIVRFGFMKLAITDWTSGFRAIKIWVIKSVFKDVQKYSGYVFQIAVIDQALKNRARIQETPIQFEDRKLGVSKISFPQYIFQILLYIFLNSSFVKFVIVGIVGFVVDFGISYFFIEKTHTKVWLATLISTETAIICNFIFNNFWSFSHKKIQSGKRNYFFSFVKFNLVSSGSIIIQTIGVQLLVNTFGKPLWYAYKVIIILFIIIPYSYFLYNKVIWKDR